MVDCCVRGKESRTRKLADAFLEGLDPKKFHVTRISPEAEGYVKRLAFEQDTVSICREQAFLLSGISIGLELGRL